MCGGMLISEEKVDILNATSSERHNMLGAKVTRPRSYVTSGQIFTARFAVLPLQMIHIYHTLSPNLQPKNRL